TCNQVGAVGTGYVTLTGMADGDSGDNRLTGLDLREVEAQFAIDGPCADDLFDGAVDTGFGKQIEVVEHHLIIDGDIKNPPAGRINAGVTIPWLGKIEFDLVFTFRHGEAIIQAITPKAVGLEQALFWCAVDHIIRN